MEELSPEQQLREDVWSTLMKIREGPSPYLMAADGWCTPNAITYTEAEIINGDDLLTLPQLMAKRGGIKFP